MLSLLGGKPDLNGGISASRGARAPPAATGKGRKHEAHPDHCNRRLQAMSRSGRLPTHSWRSSFEKCREHWKWQHVARGVAVQNKIDERLSATPCVSQILG